MPAKLTADANSAFLYAIIKNANLQSINWKAIGAECNLTSQAAYMRYNRLKAAIEKENAMKKEGGSTMPNTPKKATPNTPKKVSISSQRVKVPTEGKEWSESVSVAKRRKVDAEKIKVQDFDRDGSEEEGTYD